MKLMVFGDIHGAIHRMYEMADQWEQTHGLHIDGIVQVGDFGVFDDGYSDWSLYLDGRYEASKPTLVIMGNHEDPRAVNEWMANPRAVRHIDLLLDGHVQKFMGINIGGIWGNYSPKSYSNPQRVIKNRQSCQSHKIAMHISRYSVEELLNYSGQIDMLITHDSAKGTFPRGLGPIDPLIGEILGLEDRDEMKNAQGCPGFYDILIKFRPEYYFYGHLHRSYKTTFADTQVECLNAIQYSSTPYTVLEF